MEVEVHEGRNNSCISNSGICFVRWVLYVQKFCQIIITESFGHTPWWEGTNGTVWARGKPVVKTVELVAA